MNNRPARDVASQRSRVLVLISGRGSNLQALYHASQDPRSHYQICHVISSNKQAAGLSFVRQQQLSYQIINPHQFSSPALADHSLHQAIMTLQPDLIALAGYMHRIAACIIEDFTEQILNIHPSLLPAYPGLNTHQRVLAAKEKQHGCTVHLVDKTIDNGPILAQTALFVDRQDTVHSLEQRVLHLEHQLYPRVIEALAAAQCGYVNL